MARYRGGFGYGGFRPYVSVAARRAQARRYVKALRAEGRKITPVEVEGRGITRTFWGDAWCENLERYSDFANRLPRGRTYVRNGSVVHLGVTEGCIEALVSGSEIYEVDIRVKPAPKAGWKRLRKACMGQIDSMVDLLRGRLADGVMARICEPRGGLFPKPGEISLSCDCPDWAEMCKHVAAVLYGVGVRLDEAPELLFCLRSVDEHDLLADAAGAAGRGAAAAPENVLAGESGLDEIFGIELDAASSSTTRAASERGGARVGAARVKRKAAKRKVAKKKAAKRKVAKRKVAKKKATKRKAAKRKAVKRKVAKKKAVKRKAATRRVAKKKAATRRVAKKKATKRKATKRKAAKRKAAKRRR